MSVYRGAVVEDLQLSPALVLPSDTTIDVALRMAFEREFSIIPISDPSTRRLLGWLSTDSLKTTVERGALDPNSTLESIQLGGSSPNSAAPLKRFRKNETYQVITPDTPLEQLEDFFTKGQEKGVGFALVTDDARKFVLGVVTPDDLYKFISRREPNYEPSFKIPKTPENSDRRY